MTKRKLRVLFWIAAMIVSLFGPATGAMAREESQAQPASSGGQVLPAGARVKGYSLADAAKATAYFNTGSRTPDTLPEDFPFQILYLKPPDWSDNVFYVRPGTMLYVPVLNSDDNDAQYWAYPDVTDQAAVAAYYFDRDQLGADYLQIIVDGQVTNLGPAYAVGAVTPDLPNGANNYTVVAAFLAPLSEGSHEVKFAFQLSGANIGGVFPFDYTYKVIVR